MYGGYNFASSRFTIADRNKKKKKKKKKKEKQIEYKKANVTSRRIFESTYTCVRIH